MKTSRNLLALAVSGLMLAACAPAPYQVRGPDSDPYQEGTYRGPDQAPVPPGQTQTNEPGMNRTQRNALIGAGVGVVAGLLSGSDATERRQRALVGAGVGALAGGAIGNYQDRQERALRERMAGTGVGVIRQGDNITLSMPGNVTFAFNDASAERLQEAAIASRDNPLAFLELRDIFGEVSDSPQFQKRFTEALASLRKIGTRATLRAYIDGSLAT